MAQNSNYSEVKKLRIQDNSNFEPSQDFWAKKVSQLGILTRDHCFKPNFKRDSMNPILSHLRITCMFQHVTLAPSMAFWAISRYPPYIKCNFQIHMDNPSITCQADVMKCLDCEFDYYFEIMTRLVQKNYASSETSTIFHLFGSRLLQQ